MVKIFSLVLLSLFTLPKIYDPIFIPHLIPPHTYIPSVLHHDYRAYILCTHIQNPKHDVDCFSLNLLLYVHYSNSDCDGRTNEKTKGSARSIVLVTKQSKSDMAWYFLKGMIITFLLASPFLILHIIFDAFDIDEKTKDEVSFWRLERRIRLYQILYQVLWWLLHTNNSLLSQIYVRVCVLLLLINGSGVIF